MGTRAPGSHFLTSHALSAPTQRERPRHERAAAEADAIKRGLARAPHRSLLKADGLTDEELEPPARGRGLQLQKRGHPRATSTWSKIADAVKAGRPTWPAARRLPVDTIGVCDGIAMNHEGMKYSLTSREVIADSVECAIQGHQFDAMVLIPSCDKIVPGMLIAACRLNIPTVLVSGGPMLAGRGRHGEQTDLNSLFDAVGQVTAGTMTEEECHWLEGTACPTCGSCSGMFTANSMCCLCEALGIATSGQRHHPGRLLRSVMRLAKHAGMKVMELLRAGTTCVRDIITAAAHPGTAMAVRHGLWRLHQHGAAPHRPSRMAAGCPVTMEDWDAASARTPHLVSSNPPARARSSTCTPWAACLWSCTSWPSSTCSTECPYVHGHLARYLEGRTKPADGEVCRTHDNPISPVGACASCTATSPPTAASSRRQPSTPR